MSLNSLDFIFHNHPSFQLLQDLVAQVPEHRLQISHAVQLALVKPPDLLLVVRFSLVAADFVPHRLSQFVIAVVLVAVVALQLLYCLHQLFYLTVVCVFVGGLIVNVGASVLGIFQILLSLDDEGSQFDGAVMIFRCIIKVLPSEKTFMSLFFLWKNSRLPPTFFL